MSAAADIQGLFVALFERYNAPQVCLATVVAVDGATVSVRLPSGLVVSGVRLRAVDDGNTDGIIATPKVESGVLIATIGGDINSLAVVATSQVEHLTVDVAVDCQVKANAFSVDVAGKIQLKNKAASLKGILDDITGFITKINTAVTTLAGGTPPVTPPEIVKLKTDIASLLK